MVWRLRVTGFLCGDLSRCLAANFAAVGDLDRDELGRGVPLRLLDRVEGSLGKLKSSNESMKDGCCLACSVLDVSNPGNTISAWSCICTRAALSCSGYSRCSTFSKSLFHNEMAELAMARWQEANEAQKNRSRHCSCCSGCSISLIRWESLSQSDFVLLVSDVCSMEGTLHLLPQR